MMILDGSGYDVRVMNMTSVSQNFRQHFQNAAGHLGVFTALPGPHQITMLNLARQAQFAILDAVVTL